MSVHRTSIVLAILTFGLIVWGGHVNTTRSGMAFPDWPTSNASPMLTYAPSKWLMEGDKFWEHGHRLFASLVGLVTVALVVLSWRATPREQRPNTIIGFFVLLVLGTVASAIIGLQGMPTGFMESFMIAMAIAFIGFLVVAFRSSPERRLLWLALAAFAGVCLQGAFGGYTVRNNLPDWTSTVHGMLAEVFFMIVLAMVWLSAPSRSSASMPKPLAGIVVGTWAVLGVQFLLGALTRHTDAWGASTSWPAWDASGFLPAPELWSHLQVVVHFIHRTLAYVIAALVLVQVWMAWGTRLRTLSLIQLVLVVLQISLGAHIIWTFRGEIVTTLHVMVGVTMLAVNAIMSFGFLFGASQKETSEHTQQMVQVTT